MNIHDFVALVESLVNASLTASELKRALLNKAIDELDALRDFAEDNNQWDESDALTDRISVLLDKMSMIAKAS